MDRVGFSGPDQRMLREARMGLMVVSALFVSLIYFGFQYFRNQVNQIPDHVWSAPLAREIDPDEVLAMAKRRRFGPANQEPDVRSQNEGRERFADQRSEFQPTQPLPRETPAPAAPGSFPKSFNSEHGSSRSSGTEPINGPEVTDPRLGPRPLNPPTTIKPAGTTGNGEFQPTWAAPPRVEESTIPVGESSPNVPTEPSKAADRLAVKPIGLTALPGSAANSPTPASTSSSLESQTPDSSPPETIPPTKPAVAPEPFPPKSFVSRPDNPGPTTLAADNAKSRVPSAREFQPLWPKTHALQPHESLWDAAHKVYGDGQWFRALYQHNLARLEAETDRRQTVMLDCPAPLDLAQKFPELVPAEIAEKDTTRTEDKTRYVTIAGDCLFDIARQQLGQASRYLELLELNRDRLPPSVSHLTRLPFGLELRLPE